jgi:hypothetical protein
MKSINLLKQQKKSKKTFCFFVCVCDSWHLRVLEGSGVHDLPWGPWAPEWFMNHKHKRKNKKKKKKFLIFFVFCFFVCVCDSWHLRVLEGSGVHGTWGPWALNGSWITNTNEKTKKRKKSFFFVFCFFVCVCDSWHLRVLERNKVHDLHDLPRGPWALNGSWITNTNIGAKRRDVVQPFGLHNNQKNKKNKKIFVFFVFLFFRLCLSFKRSWGCLRETGFYDLLISRTKETFKRFFYFWLFNVSVNLTWYNMFVNISLLYNNILNSWWVVLIVEESKQRS